MIDWRSKTVLVGLMKTQKKHQAFIILAESDQHRRHQLTTRFRSIGRLPHFVDAVMGKDLSPSQKHHFNNLERQNWLPTMMQDNALGCAISHHNIWQMIAEGDDDYGFVFEDDAMPFDAAKPYISAICDQLSQLDPLLDIVFLSNRRPASSYRPLHKLPDLPDDQDFHLASVRYSSIGAESYMLSKQAAIKLLENPHRYIFEVDCMLHHWWLHNCDVYHLQPPLFAEEGRPSTIGYHDIKPWPKDGFSHKLKRKWHRVAISFIKRTQFSRLHQKLQAKLPKA